MKKAAGCGLTMFYALILFFVVGYVKCIIKVVKCNWEPIGKAEIIYSAGLLTGTAGIIGWLDIEDK